MKDRSHRGGGFGGGTRGLLSGRLGSCRRAGADRPASERGPAARHGHEHGGLPVGRPRRRGWVRRPGAAPTWSSTRPGCTRDSSPTAWRCCPRTSPWCGTPRCKIKANCPEAVVITATNPVDPLNYATWLCRGLRQAQGHRLHHQRLVAVPRVGRSRQGRQGAPGGGYGHRRARQQPGAPVQLGAHRWRPGKFTDGRAERHPGGGPQDPPTIRGAAGWSHGRVDLRGRTYGHGAGHPRRQGRGVARARWCWKASTARAASAWRCPWCWAKTGCARSSSGS